MLKLLPTYNFNEPTKTKCGEIFCHNFTDFTVYCTFCEMKTFSFEDFLQHLKNLHFAKDLCNSETASKEVNCFDGFNKDLTKVENEEDTIYDNLIQSYDDNADNDDFGSDRTDGKDFNDADLYDNDCYDEPVNILKKKPTIRILKTQDIKCSKNNKSEDFDNSESDEEYQSALSVSEYSCRKCGEIFKTAKLLTTHINSIHYSKSGERKKCEKKVLCNECGQIFPYKKCLYSHIVEYHLGFKCSMCDKRFKQLQQRDRHEFCHTAERIFFCDIQGCDKSFTHKYYLQRHIDSHNKDRKFVCDFENCSKAFHTLRCLKAHKNRHTKPKNFICDTCGYTCRENDRLRLHQRVHTGEKPYGCQECGKRFTSNAALLEHSVSHTGIRSHVCNKCNASFTRQKSLYQHQLKCTTIKSAQNF